MSGFDLTAPSMPNKKKDGFFKKFFIKEEKAALPELPPAPKEEEPVPPPPTPDINLDDIKKKLGLDEEIPIQPPQVEEHVEEEPPLPPAQAPPVLKIDDWTAEDPQTDSSPKSSFTQEAQPAHHDIIDEHLAPVAKAEEKITQELAKTEQLPDLPDWQLQQKEVPPERHFILRSGQPVRSIKELIEAAKFIDDSTFAHHVNIYRNDFANWIRDAVGDTALAAKVSQAKDKQEVIKVLTEHHAKAARKAQKEHEKAQAVIKKRQMTLQKLDDVETQIHAARKHLTKKASELQDERSKAAKAVKSKVDQVVKERVATESKALRDMKQQLAEAKDAYQEKSTQYDALVKSLAVREKAAQAKEQKIAQLTQQVKEDQAALQAEKDHASVILKESDTLKRRFEEMKTLDIQTKKNLDAISKREIEISRREQALKARESKITADLTKIQQERERLESLQQQHSEREEAVKAVEANAKAVQADADARRKAVLDVERQARDHIQREHKKLETLRKHIDTSLAGALGHKKNKLPQASKLRAHLESVITGQAQPSVVQGTPVQAPPGHDEPIPVPQARPMPVQAVAAPKPPVSAPAPKPAPKPKHKAAVKHAPKKQEEPYIPPSTKEIRFATEKELPIYQKIDECRSALEQRNLGRAKQLYSELREEFGKADVDAAEKGALYNSIRELYDDIHLAMLQ